jgi:hypothetical protein
MDRQQPDLQDRACNWRLCRADPHARASAPCNPAAACAVMAVVAVVVAISADAVEFQKQLEPPLRIAEKVPPPRQGRETASTSWPEEEAHPGRRRRRRAGVRCFAVALRGEGGHRAAGHATARARPRDMERTGTLHAARARACVRVHSGALGHQEKTWGAMAGTKEKKKRGPRGPPAVAADPADSARPSSARGLHVAKNGGPRPVGLGAAGGACGLFLALPWK